MRMLSVCKRLVLAVLAGFALAGCTTVAPPPPLMIDAHAHYTADDAEAFDPAAVIGMMDRAGVARIVVSGRPPAMALRLHAEAPQRVVLLLGVYRSPADKADWMRDAGLPARVETMLADGRWAGIGELHLFAGDAHSPVFEALVRLAASRELLLLIHGDAEVLDRAFDLAPGLRVLWAHLGTEPVPEAVAAVLARHAGRQLWVDTSVRDERIAPGGTLLPEWRALFEAHPQRFVVAVDSFSTNRWRRYGEVVAGIRAWTDTLAPPLRRRLLHDNAAAMLAPHR